MAVHPNSLAALQKTQWKPGQSGYQGRKGPKKILSYVTEMLAKDGKHPYTELMKLLPDLPASKQAEVWLELLTYCQSKPKELAEENDLGSLPLSELIKLVKEKLPELEKSVA